MESEVYGGGQEKNTNSALLNLKKERRITPKNVQKTNKDTDIFSSANKETASINRSISNPKQ